MPVVTFTDNGTENMQVDAEKQLGFRTLAYDGDLGGGTLQILTQIDQDMNPVPLPDAKLNATKVDDNGDVIQQITFEGVGTVLVELSGATAPDVKVCVR